MADVPRHHNFASAMTVLMRPLVAPLLATALLFSPVLSVARAQSTADCETAGRAAEQQYALPSGLLLAVGQVESGRWDAQIGRIVAWPWAVDAGGEGQLPNSKSVAIRVVRTLQARGLHNIDVGCFQINLLHHPDAFASLEQAFDPQANAQYAARLLDVLHARLGNWQDAIAAYHSATPELGLPYRNKVFAAWSGVPDAHAGGMQVAAFGIHIWTPAAAGAAQAVTVIRTQSSHLLPRIVTPSR